MASVLRRDVCIVAKRMVHRLVNWRRISERPPRRNLQTTPWQAEIARLTLDWLQRWPRIKSLHVYFLLDYYLLKQ